MLYLYNACIAYKSLKDSESKLGSSKVKKLIKEMKVAGILLLLQALLEWNSLREVGTPSSYPLKNF